MDAIVYNIIFTIASIASKINISSKPNPLKKSLINEKKISILLPVYNASPFLQDTLDSILQQTEKRWELIAVDDFSTDDSFSVLKNTAKKDARIQVYKNTNKGIIPALRLAFSKAEGTYITRMDADDLMEKEKLALLLKALLENGRNYLSTGMVQYFSSNELGDGYTKYQNWLNELIINNNHFTEVYKECVIPSPNWMIHREDLINCGAFDHNNYPEDYDLCFRFYQNKIKICPVQQLTHQWRDHPTRTSRTDDRYSNQHYFDLKWPYFFQLDYDPNKKLVLWGAGRKGKYLAKKIQQQNIPFLWVCDNVNKIGKDIFGVPLQAYQTLAKLHNLQIIVAVAAPKDQMNIKAFLKKHHFKAALDYFFFC